MKKLLILLAVVSFAFSSCKKSCDLGYEGKDCKTESRTKFFGVYKGSLTQDNYVVTSNFQVGTLSSSATDIQIGAMKAVMADKDGNFYIPSQVVSQGGYAFNVYGTAVIDGKELNASFSWERNGIYTNFFFTGIKE